MNTMTKFVHGQEVRYVGNDRLPHLRRGDNYRVFGAWPQPPLLGKHWNSPGPAKPMADQGVGLVVDDKTDEFGGVLSVPAAVIETIIGGVR